MPHTNFFSFAPFLVLLFLIFQGCAPDPVTIRIVLAPAAPAAASPSVLQQTVDQLTARFATTEFVAATVLLEDKNIIVDAVLRDTSATALDQLRSFFGSVSVGLYKAMEVNTPLVRTWLDSLELPPGVEKLPARPAGRPDNSLLVLTDDSNLASLLVLLNETRPTALNGVVFPSVLESNINQVSSRTIYLYQQPAGGTPLISNSGFESVATVEDEHTGLPVLAAKLTGAATKIFAEMTTVAAADNYRAIGIVVDGEVWTNPSVRSPITGGALWITTGADQPLDLSRITQQMSWEPLVVPLVIKAETTLKE